MQMTLPAQFSAISAPKDLALRYKRFVFRFIVSHCEGPTFAAWAIRHLMLRMPALFIWIMRILGLKERTDPNAPWHNPLPLASDELIRRWPKQTAFVALRLAAPDLLLEERPVRHWKEMTTTVIEGVAGAYFELGRFHRAREAMECAAAQSFRSYYFAYMLGCLYLLERNEAAALRWIVEAADISPGLAAPEEYYFLTGNDPSYTRNEFDDIDADGWLRSAYNFLGQRALHVGEGQLRPACHAKSMEKQAQLRERARPTPVLQEFLARKNIDFETMHVLPWEWGKQIGHLGMLEVALRMRELNWWNGPAVLLSHSPRVPNRAMLSLFEQYTDFTVVDDSYVDGAFRDPVARELVAMLRSHGMPYYAWKYPDGEVVPWHQAGAHAMWEWEAQDRGYPFREVYDASLGQDAELLDIAGKAFKSWGISASDWYVCVHVRESGYNLDTTDGGQSNRNASTANYEQALRYITERGGWVIKLGAPSAPSLPDMPRVVDYARGSFKSDKMDIHLIRHAKFFVGTTSGLANVAVSFGIPTAQVNCLTTEAQLWHSGVRFSLKPVFRSDGTMLSQREITSTQWRWGLFTFDTMKRYGLHAVDNSPDEILETVAEVHALADNRLGSAADDRALIDEWRTCLPVPYHYGCSQPSTHFLRKHRGTFLQL